MANTVTSSASCPRPKSYGTSRGGGLTTTLSGQRPALLSMRSSPELKCHLAIETAYHFLAIDAPRGYAASVDLELESFYWLLLWHVLRHTAHNLGPGHFASLFISRPWYGGRFGLGLDPTAISGSKLGWIGHENRDRRRPEEMLVVPGNAPLTSMMASFRVLVRVSLNDESGTLLLSHAPVLAAFTDALARPDGDWPVADKLAHRPVKKEVESVVSPFQFAPEHHLHLGPHAQDDGNAGWRAFRDAFAQGEERDADSLEGVMEMRKRKNPFLAAQLDALEDALDARDPSRTEFPRPPKRRKGTQ